MKTCLLVTSSKAPARIAATHLHALFCDYGGQNVCCEVDEGMESTIQLQVGSGRISSWEVRSVFCCDQRNHVSCCMPWPEPTCLIRTASVSQGHVVVVSILAAK